MNRILKLMVVFIPIVFVTLYTSASERPDVFRQTLESDPLIVAIIDAFREKHGGCPWLDSDPLPGAMKVMLEVEPYIYSKHSDKYRLQMANLEVQLNCQHAISATVHAFHDIERGPAPLIRSLTHIDFSYDQYLGSIYLSAAKASTLEEKVLNDPVVKKLYAVLVSDKKQCEPIENGEVIVEQAEKDYPVHGGAPLQAKKFKFSFSCPRKSGSDSYWFSGEYFLEKGIVTWQKLDSMSISH